MDALHVLPVTPLPSLAWARGRSAAGDGRDRDRLSSRWGSESGEKPDCRKHTGKPRLEQWRRTERRTKG